VSIWRGKEGEEEKRGKERGKKRREASHESPQRVDL